MKAVLRARELIAENVYFFFFRALAHLAFCAATILRLAAGESTRRLPPDVLTLAHRLLCASAMRLRPAADRNLGPERRVGAEPFTRERSRTEIA